MNVKTDLLYAGLSDTGRARRENEDRIHMDAESGLFLVADGLGGHAAGERAAETAVDMIVARLERKTGTPEDRMREAIAVANNEIHTLAEQHDEWKGMACVVTAALIEEGQVTVGHVGDSRMYVLEGGGIRKVTRDHSPVGELEDSGQLSEAAAMAHPRRNEVFRDLGSEPHSPDDDEFIEVLRFPFRPDTALLICSDGLTDQVPSERIRRTVEMNAHDPAKAARMLVQAANEAGGKDNVSVILVEGREYGPARSAATAPEPQRLPARRKSRAVLAFLMGLIVAAAAFALVRPYLVDTQDGWRVEFGTVRTPLRWKVAPHTRISDTLAKARPGDTIVVEPGTYQETIRLTPGIALVSARRHAAILRDPETVVLADGVRGSRISGFKIEGPSVVGIRIVNSDLEVTDVEITGMQEAAIDVEGDSPASIRANTIMANPGTGIVISEAARPSVTNNSITGNGKTPGALRPGIHIAGAASPVIQGNVIADNGAEQIWASPLFTSDPLLTSNVVGPLSEGPEDFDQGGDAVTPQTFGRFIIHRKLPAGGMGRVYEATDEISKQRVALKLIDRGTDSDSMQIVAAERLGVELHKRLCALDPRITSVYDTGETADYLYIVMEYIDGQDLSELSGRERIGFPFAARIAQDVLEVLAIAHNFGTNIDGREYRGIVHGDIKPRNIRLTTVGQVKVLDFGIAKAISMTRSFTHNVFGSVQYSSPERLNTGEVTVSSDLWGVAVVLYEMIARHPYFEGDSGARLERVDPQL